jgi:hypothetical protein
MTSRSRARLLEGAAQDLLRPMIGRGYKIARPLAGDLQVLDLAEIALERPGRLHHGLGHDRHQGGADHEPSRSVSAGDDRRQERAGSARRE